MVKAIKEEPNQGDTHQTTQSRPRLAILGNPPAFAEKLHVGRPNIGSREKFLKQVEDMLDRSWLTNDGPYVQQLEKALEEYLGVRNVLVMCNATIALEIAIRAIGLTGEVIVPSYTFIATAHALQWQEITPVFADIDEDTHCIDPSSVEKMITPRTSGVIGVHLWGSSCDVDALTLIAKRNRLSLLFDAAHAFGSTHKGRMIGNNGEAEVFSFHATKFFNTLEGGAVATNNDSLADKIRLMRNFGFAGYDNVVHIGTNGKMSEVSAAMGLCSLDSIDVFLEANRANYEAYRANLTDVPGLSLMSYDSRERVNYQYVVVEVNNESTLSRDELIAVLHAENILARRYFYPGCHRMEPYRSLQPHAGLLLPVTEKVANRVFLLPTGTAIDPVKVKRICDILKFAYADDDEVRRAVHQRVRETN